MGRPILRPVWADVFCLCVLSSASLPLVSCPAALSCFVWLCFLDTLKCLSCRTPQKHVKHAKYAWPTNYANATPIRTHAHTQEGGGGGERHTWVEERKESLPWDSYKHQKIRDYQQQFGRIRGCWGSERNDNNVVVFFPFFPLVVGSA